MDDALLVSAMRKQEPRGLAGVYDKYAARLYAYSWFLLRDHDTAADALYDSMLIAANRVEALRAPDKLRPWLYSIARGESHRLARHADRATEMEAAGEPTEVAGRPAAGVRDSELRSIVWSAYERLSGRTRELLELSVRHGLDHGELALIFGASPERITHAEAKARAEFDDSIAPLVLARTGAQHCKELSEILTGWDGRASALPRSRVSRHMDACARCRTRRKQGMDTLAMLRLLPVAQVPSSLRHSVLTDGFDKRLESFRDGLGRHAKPFNDAGFPLSYERRRRRAMALPTAVAAAAVVTGVAVSASMLLPSGGHTATLATDPLPKPGASAPATPLFPSPSASASPSQSASPPTLAAATTSAPADTVTAPMQVRQENPAPPPPRVSTPPKTPPRTPPPTKPPAATVKLGADASSIEVDAHDGSGSATFNLVATGGTVTVDDVSASSDVVSAHASDTTVTPGAPVTVRVRVSGAHSGSATITIKWHSGTTSDTLTLPVSWAGAGKADPQPSATASD